MAKNKKHNICTVTTKTSSAIERNQKSLLRFLKNIPIFSCLPFPVLYKVVPRFKRTSFKKGEIVIREGDLADCIYIIESGMIGLYSDRMSHNRPFTTLMRGHFLGEMGLLSGEPRNCTARVLVDSILYYLDREEFEDLLNSYPEIGLYLSRLYARRLSGTVNNPSAVSGPSTSKTTGTFRKAERAKIGLALGAGSAREFAHLGVIEILEAAGIELDMIAGSSIGALVGCIYSHTGSIERTKELIFNALPTRLKAQRRLFDYTLPVTGIIKGENILRLLRKALGNASFEDLLIPTYVVAVDLLEGEEVVIEKGDVCEAIRASISIPGIIRPYRLNGRWFVDGGLLHPVPVDIFVRKGADFIIGVCVQEAAQYSVKNPFNTPGIKDVLLKTINILHSHATGSCIKRADVIIYPDVSGYAWNDFHRGKELARAGREACLKHIDEIKRTVSSLRGMS